MIYLVYVRDHDYEAYHLNFVTRIYESARDIALLNAQNSQLHQQMAIGVLDDVTTQPITKFIDSTQPLCGFKDGHTVLTCIAQKDHRGEHIFG